MKTVLFVCSANTIRSAMAEAWFNHLAENNPNLDAESAGVAAINGDEATAMAIQTVRESGIDLSDHRSRRLNSYMVNQADYIFAATEKHVQYIKKHFPENADKVALFNTNTDINYPAAGSINQHQSCFDTICHYVEKIYKNLSG